MDSNYSIKGSSKGRGRLIVDQYDSLSCMKLNQKQQQFICGFCNQEIPIRFMISHKKVCLQADKNQYMIDRNQLPKQKQTVRVRNRKLSNHIQPQFPKKMQHNILLGKSNSQKNNVKSQKRKTRTKIQQSFRGMYGTLSSADVPKIIDKRNRQSHSKHQNNKKSGNINSVKAQQNVIKKSIQPKNSKRQDSKHKRITSTSKTTQKREQSVKNMKTTTKNRNIYDNFMTKSNIHENNSNLKKKSNIMRRNRRNFTHNPIVKNENIQKFINQQAQQEKREARQRKNHIQPTDVKRINVIKDNRAVRKNRQYTGNSRNEKNRQDIGSRRERSKEQSYGCAPNVSNSRNRNRNTGDQRNRMNNQQYKYQQDHHLSESIESQQSFQEQQQYEQWGANRAMNFISDTLNQQFSMLNSQFSMMNQIFSNFNNLIPQGQTQYYFQNQNGNFIFRHNGNFEQQNDESGEVYEQQQQLGLNEQELQQIPKRRYNERLDNQQQCTVCIGQIKNKQIIKILPCIHMFHVECIDQWLRRKAVCPVCREKVSLE